MLILSPATLTQRLKFKESEMGGGCHSRPHHSDAKGGVVVAMPKRLTLVCILVLVLGTIIDANTAYNFAGIVGWLGAQQLWP
jgi:hypothetical protein